MKLSRRYFRIGSAPALGLPALGSKSAQAAEITEAEGRVIAKEAYDKAIEMPDQRRESQQ
ncbi:hypothetical protein GCM10010869_50380 [Mesorhizobium tianshanense]|uniref:Uncharacterized protein n=1 Tax=Mesorhizobium tianshanense TaxID=39844 RepID=A0A562PG42_9HYPH|nr:hypothetical protein [Mesorhizobium tianshanense]TWI43303.1 hypothetical protein IQ26_00265 [Mesorhizobium tianshanense]GLS39441.1 hypothetical protein GCM10010869_50380 [Mesorhizobium tianshanense]